MIPKAAPIVRLGRSPRSESRGAFDRDLPLGTDGSGAPSSGGRGFRNLTLFVSAALLAIIALGVGIASADSPPSITDEFATPVTSTDATLWADINPQGVDTAYHLEYGPADCSANPCTSIPATDADIGSGTTDTRVSQSVHNLTPDTTYHYRFVATSTGGTTDGADQTIHTFAAGGPFQLPDNRAYEMVSPPDKNGGSVQPNPTRTRVAADGNAATFVSLTSFGDAQGNGAIAGTEYMSLRSPGGWSTHAITPLQTAPDIAPLESTDYLDAFSSDLGRGVFFSNTVLAPGSGNTDGVRNLYLRDDLRTPGAGHYTLLTDSTSPLPPVGFESNPHLFMADHTPDFGHVTFETTDNLTPDASGTDPKLYEWDHGTVRLAGVLPDSACAPAPPPCLPPGSVAGRELLNGNGQYTTGTVHTISTDGTRILFAPTPLVDGPADAHTSNGLYMRIDHTSTIQLNLSEKTNGAGPGGTDPNGPQPVSLQAATPDLSRVFFTTAEELTNDDNNAAPDLYMWDANQPAGQHLTLISQDNEPSDDSQTSQPKGKEVFAVSPDGSYVYFGGDNKLVSGQADEPDNEGVNGTAIYVWHAGVVRFVGWTSEVAGTDELLKMNSGLLGKLSQAAPDGRNFLFVGGDFTVLGPGLGTYTPSNYTGNCNSGVAPPGIIGTACAQVFLYSFATDTLRCVSCDPTGAAPVGNGNTEVAAEYSLSEFAGRNEPTWITADGSKVFFSSGDPLVPEDTNGRYDAYEYDTQTGEFHLISTGTSGQDSYFVNASPDGSNVFFTTRQRLVGIDTDNSRDLYDARVGGGIAAQNPPPGVPCNGEACQGPGSGSPNDPGSGSSTFSGPGNQGKSSGGSTTATKRCKKGHKRRKHHKCKKSKKRAVRRANTTGRASR